jgi:hypothetical protein
MRERGRFLGGIAPFGWRAENGDRGYSCDQGLLMHDD